MVDRYRSLIGPEQIDASASQFNTGQGQASQELANTFKQFSGESANLAGDLFAQKATQNAKVDAENGTDHMARGIDAFTKAGQAYNNAFEATYTAKTQIDIKQTLDRFKLEHEDDPVGYQQKVNAYSTALLASTPKLLQPKAQIMLQSVAVAQSAELADSQRRVQHEDNLGAYFAGASARTEAIKAALSGPKAEEAIGAMTGDNEAHLQTLIDNHDINPAKAGRLRSAFAAKIQADMADHQIDQYATPLLNDLRSDTVEGAKSLDQFLHRTDVPEEIKAKVAARVDSGRSAFEAERSRAFAPQVAELSQRLAAGEGGNNIEGQVNGAARIGAISNDLRRSMLDQSTRNQLEKNKKDADFAAADLRIRQGLPADPGDPQMLKGYNEWFDRHTAIAGSQPGDPSYNRDAADFLRNSNVLPKSATSYLRTAIATQTGDLQTDAIRAAGAVTMYKQLNEANPKAMPWFVDEKQLSFIDQMGKGMEVAGSAGSPSIVGAYKTAYKNVYQTTPEEQKLLSAQYRQDTSPKTGNTNLRAMQNALSDASISPDLPGYDNIDPQTRFKMQASIEERVAAEYRSNGGQLKDAQDLAVKRELGSWGMSRITNSPPKSTEWGGDAVQDAPVVTHYPPEKLYGVTLDDIQKAKNHQLDEAGYGPFRDNVVLREIPGMTEESRGQVWRMVTKNFAGDEDYVKDANGQAVNFHVPVNQEYTRVYNEHLDAAMAEAAAKRAHTLNTDSDEGKIWAWQYLQMQQGQ